jgi:hypothetical protein
MKMPSVSDWAVGIMAAIMIYGLLVVTP